MCHSQVALIAFLGVLHGAPRTCLAVTTDRPEDMVNLMTGTSTPGGANSNSDGNTFPQVKMPWGFNDWVPHTDQTSQWFFHPQDTTFFGMKCTHQPSPWIGDYGSFALQPHLDDAPGTLNWTSAEATFHPYLFKAALKHPIQDKSIDLEFAPTSHAGIMRLNFPHSAEFGYLSLVEFTGQVSSTVEDGVTVIRGVTMDASGGVPDNYTGMFITMKARHLEQPAPLALVRKAATVQVQTVNLDEQDGQQQEMTEKELAAQAEDARSRIMRFRTNKGPVVVSVATSFISQAQADLNLKQEIGEKSFDTVMAEGKATWSKALNRVEIDALDQTQLEVFYTNLWKSMLFPRYLTETNKDGDEVHMSPYTGTVQSGKMVTDSGFWDSFRSVYQLQSLIFPDNLGGMIQGWVNSYKEAGWLPQWASPGRRDSMVATMGDVVLADAIVKSKLGYVKGFDVDKAYEAIRKDAYTIQTENSFGRTGMDNYINKGYVISDGSGHQDGDENVAQTLNYYEADAAIARAAAALGKTSDQHDLERRTKGYGIIFNKTNKFFQPKGEKDFLPDFDPLAWGSGFTEAGAWQYRFSLPFDVDGLSKLYDGKLCENINSMMTWKRPWDGNASSVASLKAIAAKAAASTGVLSDGMSDWTGEDKDQDGLPDAYHVGSFGRVTKEMTEMDDTLDLGFGQYSHGNQPVHHILYVAKKAGCNALADEYLRKVMSKLYTLKGWAGDEDNGEMGAWYILSALGIYQLEGAKDEMVLGSPAINNANLQLPNNKFLKVATENQSSENVHVQAVTWAQDGQSKRTITNSLIKYTELMHGGTLTFTMGSKPKPAPNLRQTNRH